MSTSCTVCRLPFAGAIDELLRSERSASSIAADFDLSYDSVTRHKRNHLARLALAEPPDADPDTDPLVELSNVLRVRALSGSDAAAREYRLALAALSDRRQAIPPVRRLEDEPEWITLRSKMLEALEPFPEARIAIADALKDVA